MNFCPYEKERLRFSLPKVKVKSRFSLIIWLSSGLFAFDFFSNQYLQNSFISQQYQKNQVINITEKLRGSNRISQDKSKQIIEFDQNGYSYQNHRKEYFENKTTKKLRRAKKMFWKFFKLTRAFMNIRTGKNVFLRFFILQGRDLVEQQLQEERKRHKIFMKRFQNQFYYRQFLNASRNFERRPKKYENEPQFDNDSQVHVIKLGNQEYVDDLETVVSDYEGGADDGKDFQFLDASFVEDV